MIGLRPMPGRERTRLNDEAPLGLSTRSEPGGHKVLLYTPAYVRRGGPCVLPLWEEIPSQPALTTRAYGWLGVVVRDDAASRQRR
jgi:hypothetical protein